MKCQMYSQINTKIYINNMDFCDMSTELQDIFNMIDKSLKYKDVNFSKEILKNSCC